MATIDEQITALKAALATGSRSVAIGDRSITYRDVSEIQQILSQLQAEKSAQSGSSYVPFGVLQINYSKGI